MWARDLLETKSFTTCWQRKLRETVAICGGALEQDHTQPEGPCLVARRSQVSKAHGHRRACARKLAAVEELGNFGNLLDLRFELRKQTAVPFAQSTFYASEAHGKARSYIYIYYTYVYYILYSHLHRNMLTCWFWYLTGSEQSCSTFHELSMSSSAAGPFQIEQSGARTACAARFHLDPWASGRFHTLRQIAHPSPRQQEGNNTWENP